MLTLAFLLAPYVQTYIQIFSDLDTHGIVGSVVECSPATRAARVRFPDDAVIFVSANCALAKMVLEAPGIDPGTSHMLSERSTI